MESFQTKLKRNIVEKPFSRYDKNGIVEHYIKINLGSQTWYYQSQIGAEGCNGTFCIEEVFTLYSNTLKDTSIFVSWGGMGFFTDVNGDRKLDFVDISETNKHIYEEDTFMVQVYSLQNFEFIQQTDSKGNPYFIKIYWPGGLFGDNSRRPVYIIDQRWYYKVK